VLIMTKKIELTQGKFALVSDHRFEYLNQWKWCAVYKRGKWRAMRKQWFPVIKTIYMHRVIMNVTDSQVLIDHWDGDSLNNQDENLRICTNTENLRNRGAQKNNTSGYKGVHWNKDNKNWVAQIQVNRKIIYLGSFANINDAAKAYNKAAEKYHGEFAQLNQVQS